MRIKEEFKKSGYFWIPSTPDRRVPGTLYISDGGAIELELIEPLDRFTDEPFELFNSINNSSINDLMNIGRIAGIIEEDGCVTLENCVYKEKNRILGGGVSKKSLIHVHKAFVGVAYEEGEDISFNSFSFSVEGIDEWMGKRSVKVQIDKDEKNVIMTYSRPTEIPIDLNNGMKLTIKFDWSRFDSSTTTEFKITQKAYFELISIEEKELDEFISIAYKITTFLSFAIDRVVCLEWVIATSNKIIQNVGEDETIPVCVKIYYQNFPSSKDNSSIDWHKMLFLHGEIEHNADKVINNWIDAYDRIDPALNLYFSTKVGAQKYLEGKFLALVQGLETYHRRTSTDKLMDEKKFKELVEKIVSKCPVENKEWLEGRLRHGNEINLRKRIESIVKPFKDIIGNAKERSKIITRIVATRNYLTHYDESSKLEAADGQDLLLLCYKMEAFFQLHFLQVLGFTQEEINSVVTNSYPLKEKLNLKL
jgi:hypothetical protein